MQPFFFGQIFEKADYPSVQSAVLTVYSSPDSVQLAVLTVYSQQS